MEETAAEKRRTAAVAMGVLWDAEFNDLRVEQGSLLGMRQECSGD